MENSPEPITVSHPWTVNVLLSKRLDKIVARATALAAGERYLNAAKMKLALIQLL
jgi:hypothetical protein